MTLRRFFSAFFRPALPTLFALSAGCSDPAEEEKATNPWSGGTYLLTIRAQDWSEPRGIGQDIDDFVPNFLLRVDGEEPDSFSVAIATAHDDGAQDTCNETSSLDATANPPGVLVGPAEFPLYIRNMEEGIAVNATAYGLTIKDVLPHDGVASGTGEFTATLDFQQIYPLVTGLINPTPETSCSAFEDTFSAPCQPCPADGHPYCLTLKATALSAVPTDEPIEPVDSIDPSCVPTTPAP